jgi:hypothetical protein
LLGSGVSINNKKMRIAFILMLQSFIYYSNAQNLGIIPKQDLNSYKDTTRLEIIQHKYLKYSNGKVASYKLSKIKVSDELKTILLSSKIIRKTKYMNFLIGKYVKINSKFDGILIEVFHQFGREEVLIIFNRENFQIISHIMIEELFYDEIYSKLKYEDGCFIRESYVIKDFKEDYNIVDYYFSKLEFTETGLFKIIYENIENNKKAKFVRGKFIEFVE